MEPQSPQFDGQFSYLNTDLFIRASERYNDLQSKEREAFDSFIKSPSSFSLAKHVKLREYADIAKKDISESTVNVPTEHLVKYFNGLSADHNSGWLSASLPFRKDFTPEHRHQLVMSPNASVSHSAAHNKNDDTAIKAIHKLIHGDCLHCKYK